MPGPAMFNDPPVRTDAMLSMLRSVQRRLLLLTAGAAVLGVAVGALVAGLAGVWGALLAAALGLIFMITTVAALRFVAGRGPEVLQLILVGGWIVKLVLVVIVLLWLRTQDFYHRGVFFGVLVVVVLGGVLVEIGTAVTARIPYVDAPAPSGTEDVSRVTEPAAPSGGANESTVEPRVDAEERDPDTATDADDGPEVGR